MIRSADACGLATALKHMATAAPDRRLCYCVCPSRMTATAVHSCADVPILTGHGEVAELGKLIHSFHQWGEPIQIGLMVTGGLLQFWIEDGSE